jgi:hypothetical protein
MLHQHCDRPVRVPSQRQVLELAMFGGDIAMMVVGEHPVPAAVQLRAVAE